MVETTEIWRFNENPEKNPGENPVKIWKPDFLEKSVIISYLMSKLSILWRNMVQTTEIWNFEKWDQFLSKNKKKRFLNFGALLTK